MSDQNARVVISAVDNASKVFANVRGSMDGLATAATKLRPLLASLGVSLSVGAATAFFRGVTNGIDALNDLKDATGSSIENISALEDVAARTGTSFDTVGTSLVKFNAALTSAKPGTESLAAFKALGLSVEQLKSQDPSEALRRTAVALSKFADDGNKARLVQELFGKSLKEVAPFLNDLATQGELAAKVTTAQAEAAEKFNHQLSVLGKNSTDAARSLVSDLLPALSKSLEIFTKLRENGVLFDVIKDAAKGVVGLQRLSGNAAEDVNRLIAERTKLEERLQAQVSLRAQTGFRGKDSVAAGLEKEIFEVNKLLEVSRIRQIAGVDTSQQFSDKVSRSTQKGRPGLPSALGAGKDKRLEDAERYLDALQKQLEAESELTAVEKVRQDVALGRIKLNADEIKYAEFLADLADKSKGRKEQEKAKLELLKQEAEARNRASKIQEDHLEQLAKEAEALVNSNKQLREQVEEIGLSAAELNKLRLARLDANIAEEDALFIQKRSIEGHEAEAQAIERRINLLKQQRDLTGTKGEKEIRTQEAEENKKRTDALTESISDGILNGFRNGKGFADVFLDELKAQFAKTVLQPVIRPFVEAGNAALGNILKNLFSFDGGGYTGDGARTGGIDGKGGFLGVLHPRESIVDHTRGQGGAGAQVTVVNHFAVGDVASMSYVQGVMANTTRAMQAQIARSLTAGGALA